MTDAASPSSPDGETFTAAEGVERLHAAFTRGDLEGAARMAEALLARGLAAEHAHNVLGMIAYGRRDYPEAVRSLEAATQADPNFSAPYANLGASLRALGDAAGAEAAYRQALALNPASQNALGNLANLLVDNRKPAEAQALVEQALAAGPPNANLMTTLAMAHYHLGRLVEAAAAFRRALELDPASFEACRNLGSTLAALGQFDEAEGLHRRALELRPDYAEGHSSLLFGLNYRPDLSAGQVAAAYREFDARHAARLRPAWPVHANARDPERRLRLGYVSPDFNDHVVSAFMLPLLEAHDRERFELCCYAEVRHADATTARIRGLADRWTSTVGMSDAAVAERILADGVDVLVDLAGHTTGNRMMAFARRPAPVQLTYFVGHGSTTGLSAFDGFIADSALAPPGCEALFSEPVVRLDRIPLVYSGPATAPGVGPLPALANGHVTFGHFGRPIRLNEGVIAAWAAILNAVPRSRLMLNYAPFGDEAVRSLFAGRFARHGVGRERLELVFTTPQVKTWAAYGEIDIALDPFPHNAGTTTVEALWMGAPVVSLADRPPVGRFGAMILGALGLEDWVAADVYAYVARAVRAAGDLEGLAALRAGLRGRFAASAFGDPDGLARAMEGAYRGLWRDWCARP